MTAVLVSRLWIPLLVIALVVVESTASLTRGLAQIEWIVSKGGYFNPKLELRQFDPTDDKSPSGFFAKDSISKHEKLMVIPKECLVTSGVEDSEDTCDTVMNLVEQYKLGEKSAYWPYVDYLFHMHGGVLPSEWSKEGKALIDKIVGVEMPPSDTMTSMTFADRCERHSTGDPLEQTAYNLVLRRSWDDIMVPVLDMCNHRNGAWRNLDSNSIHDGDDITVFATRPVAAGEQMYLSYNECADCSEYSYFYALQHILRDYGFIEQYPRRWYYYREPDDQVNTYEGIVTFELDDGKRPGDDPNAPPTPKDKLTFTLLSEIPLSDDDMHIFQGFLHRLKKMEKEVYQRAEKEVSVASERETILEYYDAMVTGLEYLIAYVIDEEIELEDDEYDDLEVEPDTMSYWDRTCSLIEEPPDYLFVETDSTESLYQRIEFSHRPDNMDTCVWLNNHLNACMSFRPHYHEVLVHYPAGFFARGQFKRVIFIGGGDNLVIHEILKYPSLELVLGLELDQAMVRSSFKNFGSQPHWDDERVQWWFGDGSQSLRMIPREYFGTFDLVIVDLQTDIVEQLDIMEYVSVLMSPGGIFIRNEDGHDDEVGWGSSKSYTKYLVDLYFDDVPIICHQGLTMGSNAIDFLYSKRHDHKVDMVYVSPVGKADDGRFSGWYNFRNTSATGDYKTCDDEHKLSNKSPPGGVLMVLEAEDASLPLDSLSELGGAITAALNTAGLTILSTTSVKDDEETEQINMMFLLKEGYVVARAFPFQKYCAFDLLLWSSFSQQDVAKKELLKAVGSKIDGISSSSFRVVTGGMFGLDDSDIAKDIGPPPGDETCKSVDDKSSATGQAPMSDAVDAALRAGVSLNDETKVVVLLSNDDSQMKAFKKVSAKVISLLTCKDVKEQKDACHVETLSSLTELVKSNGKIDSIVIAPDVPRPMGQVLHKVLSTMSNRKKLLNDQYSLVEVSLFEEGAESNEWREALLDRFRTDFVMYNPAFRAEVLFRDNTSGLKLGIFSAGDSEFYSHLVNVIHKIEKEANVVADVHYVKNGFNNYVADFEQTSRKTSHNDYDNVPSEKQWRSQRPLARQTIFQYKITEPGELTPTKIETALAETLKVRPEWASLDIGDGCIMGTVWRGGSIVVTWDGKNRVVANFFKSKLDVEPHNSFADDFIKGFPAEMELTSRDEQPRGTGRVVNFDTKPAWMWASDLKL